MGATRERLLKLGRGARRHGHLPSAGGFTLVELLVTLVIVVALAGILLTVYGRSVGKAKQTTCASNLHQLALAIRMYSEDYGGYGPPLDTGDELWSSPLEGMVILMLEPYQPDRSIWYCPSDPWAGKWVTDQVPHRWTSYETDMWAVRYRTPKQMVWDARRYASRRPFWHFGGYNAAFPDGSVKWFPGEPGFDPPAVWEDPD